MSDKPKDAGKPCDHMPDSATAYEWCAMHGRLYAFCQIASLKALNAELVEALKSIDNHRPYCSGNDNDFCPGSKRRLCECGAQKANQLIDAALARAKAQEKGNGSV